MGYIPIMTPGERAQWAIVHEASAIKAGNVHPDASFAEMTHDHFLRAAEAIGSAIDAAHHVSLGASVRACVSAMLDTVNVNTSLGTILLLVPLAKVDSVFRSDRSHGVHGQCILHDAIMGLLSKTNAMDCANIYHAIALCNPGGIGKSERMDVRGAPPESILHAMELASGWDDIALQYCNGFEQVLRYAFRLQELAPKLEDLPHAVRRLQGEILAQRCDSLIVRKHGPEVGETVRAMASSMIDRGSYGSIAYESAWVELDRFLRLPGARKNPGTTADLIAGALYVASPKWT